MSEVSTKPVKFMNADEYSQDELMTLAKLYDQSFKNVKVGDIIQGKIVQVASDNVVIDVGFKAEGIIPKSEFTAGEEIKLGNMIDVVIEVEDDGDGNLLLSKKRADFIKIWNKVIHANENDEVITGKILKRVKGGMVVDIFGMESFLPGSQIDIKPIRDFDALVGQVMDFKVVKVNHLQENIVVSHKVLIEEQTKEQREALLNNLQKGQVLEGTVKAITDFGVFIDLGGVDGLIHITDLSWGRINHPSEVVKLDEKIKVVVTDYDPERKRISLGIKQLTSHPWEKIEEKYQIGAKVKGRVVSLTDYGAFIEIEKGIEGLIHISEMSWTQHIKHPSQFVTMGQLIEAVILTLDKEERKISLGIKQLTPDPWQELLQKYPVESKHSGIVRNLTNFGVFVELEPGVDGLIHISDLSWTKKIRHPGEIVKKGETIEVVVLSIDTEQRKISLGHKQILDNPWDTFEKEFAVGTAISAKVSRIIEKGLIVELPKDVDGFVPAKQLSTSRIKNLSVSFPVDQELELRVVEFNKEKKRIVLSALAALKEKSVEEMEEYIKKYKLEKVTPDDIMKADTGAIDPTDLQSFDPESETAEEPANVAETTEENQ